MSATQLAADLDRLIGEAIAHNARILVGDRMLEALADDSDHLPADLIPTGPAQAALRAAQARSDQPLPADQLETIQSRADLRRRLSI